MLTSGTSVPHSCASGSYNRADATASAQSQNRPTPARSPVPSRARLYVDFGRPSSVETKFCIDRE
ncbi:hypothetical protein FQA47_002350 [Oryzias melastigma]|uniref:Uncharacterized protein n=1 Tax=Oryzias melastigma TaxID=30732 RepID=A0A834FKC8_ORYME|nr:hypothetical protein FQA47_002350 [Oryzias melastigma]